MNKRVCFDIMTFNLYTLNGEVLENTIKWRELIWNLYTTNL